MVKEVSVQELKLMIDNGEDFQLIDVREPYEADIAAIGGMLIPMGEVPTKVDMFARDKKVIVHCRSGARSGNVVQYLQDTEGMDNLYNLAGGILAWSREIDPSIPQY